MKKIRIMSIVALLIIVGCQTKQQKDIDKKEVKSNESHNLHKEHKNDANMQMHKTSVSDLIKRFESPERDVYQRPKKVLDYIGDVHDKKIMDIGAGSGYFSVKLAKRGAYVIAGDVDDAFLEYINNRIKKEVLDSLIEVRKLAYDSPALEIQEVDKVLIVNTYHHIEERPQYFKKVLKGLKHGGELIVIDFFKKELPIGPSVTHKISRERVIKELQQAGFTNFTENVDLLKMQFIIRAKK